MKTRYKEKEANLTPCIIVAKWDQTFFMMNYENLGHIYQHNLISGMTNENKTGFHDHIIKKCCKPVKYES